MAKIVNSAAIWRNARRLGRIRTRGLDMVVKADNTADTARRQRRMSLASFLR